MIQQVLISDFLKFMILEILNFHPNDIVDTVKHLDFTVVLIWRYWRVKLKSAKIKYHQ